MDIQELIRYQGYGYFFLVTFLTIGLYAYIYHLYKSQRTGRKDYEKYAKLALDDDLTSATLEYNNRRDRK